MSLRAMLTLFLSNESAMKAQSVRGHAGCATVTVDSDEIYLEIHVQAKEVAAAERLVARLQDAIALAKRTREAA